MRRLDLTIGDSVSLQIYRCPGRATTSTIHLGYYPSCERERNDHPELHNHHAKPLVVSENYAFGIGCARSDKTSAMPRSSEMLGAPRMALIRAVSATRSSPGRSPTRSYRTEIPRRRAIVSPILWMERTCGPATLMTALQGASSAAMVARAASSTWIGLRRMPVAPASRSDLPSRTF